MKINKSIRVLCVNCSRPTGFIDGLQRILYFCSECAIEMEFDSKGKIKNVLAIQEDGKVDNLNDIFLEV